MVQISETLVTNCGLHVCYNGTTFSLWLKFSISDVDECLVDGVCSQICVNEKGTFKCECHEGYSKDPRDRTRCKADEGHAALLFTHRTDIRHLSLEHDRISSVVNDTHSSTALDFHFRSVDFVAFTKIEEELFALTDLVGFVSM